MRGWTLGLWVLLTPVAAAALELRRGDLVVSDAGSSAGDARILRVDPGTGGQELLAADGTGLPPYFGIGIDPTGYLYYTLISAIAGLDPVTGDGGIVSGGGSLFVTFDVAMGADGKLVATSGEGFMVPGGAVPARVVLVDPATGGQSVLASGGNLELPTSVVISQTGQILIADPQTDEAQPGLVIRVNPGTGQQTVLSGGESILQRPTHLAIEPTGHLVVSDPEIVAVVRIDRFDLSQSVVSSDDLLVRPGAIAVAPDGTIYVADADANRILSVDPGNGSQAVVAEGANLIRPSDLGVDPAGRLVVVDPDVFGGGALLRVDPGTGAQEVILLARYLFDPEYVAVSRSGEALVSVNGGVAAIDPASGRPSRFYGEGLLSSPRGLEVAPDGEIWVADRGAGSQEPRVVRVDPQTGAQSLVTEGQLLSAPSDLAFADDGDLLVADESAGAVVRVDPTTGAQEIETSAPSAPLGVVARDDRIWVSESGNIRRIEADGSSQVVFSGADDFFAIDFDGEGRLVAADPGDDLVLAIDPESGDPTTLASGDLLVRPRSVAVVPEPGGAPALLVALAALAALRPRTARA